MRAWTTVAPCLMMKVDLSPQRIWYWRTTQVLTCSMKETVKGDFLPSFPDFSICTDSAKALVKDSASEEFGKESSSSMRALIGDAS